MLHVSFFFFLNISGYKSNSSFPSLNINLKKKNAKKKCWVKVEQKGTSNRKVHLFVQ